MSNFIKYEKKPIAKLSREILTLCQQISANMGKMYKYQLGSEICSAGIKLATSVYLALDEMGYSKVKETRIKRIIEKMLKLIVLVRVAKDIGQIKLEYFESIINKLVALKNQTENWLMFIQKKETNDIL